MVLLEVKDVRVYYKTRKGIRQAVDGVSFTVEQGESLGLAGESGCGKTTIAKAIIRLLAPNSYISSGDILYKGHSLTGLTESMVREIRWKEISMIPQSAMNAMDPVYRVGAQIIEAIRRHEPIRKEEGIRRACDLFEMVGLPPERLQDYPHQLSGGMRQRSAIAMALALKPSLVIADEPTTALDVITQHQILEKINELRREFGTSMIFITHDISVIANTCDKIAIMYAGKIMEYGSLEKVMRRPFHPYTIGLENAFLSIDRVADNLISIPGSPPDLINPPKGCLFRYRCPFGEPLCLENPDLIEVEERHFSACHFPNRVEEFREKGIREEVWQIE
jgi:oligopeptide/dipeptide ABC transporter ATP-binding protein